MSWKSPQVHTHAKLLDAVGTRSVRAARDQARVHSGETRVEAFAWHSTVPIDVEATFGKFSTMTSEYSVELPGIEPVAEIALSCGNVETNDAKVRETTRNDVGIRERC